MPLELAQTFAWQSEPLGVWAQTDCRLVRDLTPISLDHEIYERPVLRGDVLAPTMAGVVTRQRGSVAFKSELKGNSVEFATGVTPDYHHLLQASGYMGTYAGGGNTWTYVRTTQPDSHASAAFYQIWSDPAGGVNAHAITLLTARTDWTIEFVPGEVGLWSWTARGIRAASSLGIQLVPLYAADIAPPVVQAVTFDPYGDAPAAEAGHIRKVTLAARNNLVYAPSLSTTYADRAVLVNGYGPAGTPGVLVTIDVEVPQSSVAVADIWIDRWTSQTLAAGTLAIVVGSGVAHNQTTFTLGGLRIEGPPKYSAQDGMLVASVPCRALGTAAGTTNDDLTIVAT